MEHKTNYNHQHTEGNVVLAEFLGYYLHPNVNVQDWANNSCRDGKARLTHVFSKHKELKYQRCDNVPSHWKIPDVIHSYETPFVEITEFRPDEDWNILMEAWKKLSDVEYNEAYQDKFRVDFMAIGKHDCAIQFREIKVPISQVKQKFEVTSFDDQFGTLELAVRDALIKAINWLEQYKIVEQDTTGAS